MLLKPISLPPSNRGSLRLFQRDKSSVLRSPTVRCNYYLWATKAPQVTRISTHNKGNAPLRGWILLLLILNSIHNMATDCHWARSHSKHCQLKKNSTPVNSVQQFTVWISSWAPYYWAMLQHQYDKAPKKSQGWVIMKYMPGFFSWCQASALQLWKQHSCFSKVISASNITPNTTRSADSFSTVLSRMNGVDWGWIVHDLETVNSLSLTHIQFHSPQVTPHTNPVQITIQELCNSCSLTWGWHNQW